MGPLAALLLISAPLSAAAGSVSPLSKVIELMDSLAAKVTKDGEDEAKAFVKYTEWCDNAAHNAQFAIEDATKQTGELEASINKLESDIAVAASNIEKLAAAIASSDGDLTDATVVREKEAADYAASEKELVETVDTLGRAIGVLEREMAKSPAALAQLNVSSAAGPVQALAAVLDAASFPTDDARRLQSLLQEQQRGAEEDGDDQAPGAPAVATYATHSSGILDVLEDLKEKAEGQLSQLRKAETNSRHNFDLLKSSLEAQKSQDSKDLDDEKANKAGAEEGKATSEGELASTAKLLADSKDELSNTQQACMTVAADHEATVAGREEELKVIAQAKQILIDTSSGAVSQTYALVQVGATLESRSDLARSEVVALVKRLAKVHHSAALAQLASRLAALAKYGASIGEDPFAKIKGLIQDMIEKLEREAGAEAEEKAYCDEQMAKTEAKKGELEDEIAKMTSKIDTAAARSAQLKEEVSVLQSELAALSREQAEMDKIRLEKHAAYEVAKADLELGLTGVRQALSVLREYYSAGEAAGLLQNDAAQKSFLQQPAPPVKHDRSAGAGTSIIGILEVVESDFAKNLAQEETEEADAESEYQRVSQENKITKATKEQDETYKTQEAAAQDKTVAEYSSDREGATAELTAVLEYYEKIKGRCIAKPEAYEERMARREAEIAGLKSALQTLQEETALLQRGSRAGRHRGRADRGFLAANF